MVPKDPRAIFLVVIVSGLLVSSTVILAMVNSGDQVYALEEPYCSIAVPETLWYFPVGAGVTEHSIPITLTLHGASAGLNLLRASVVLLRLWVKDLSNGVLNDTIVQMGSCDVHSTPSPLTTDHSMEGVAEEGWWSAGVLTIDLDESPSAVDPLVTVDYALLLVNVNTPLYTGHSFLLKFSFTVVYSRWLSYFRVVDAQQTEDYNFTFGGTAPIEVQPLPP
jgi:hypothetical protein